MGLGGGETRLEGVPSGGRNPQVRFVSFTAILFTLRYTGNRITCTVYHLVCDNNFVITISFALLGQMMLWEKTLERVMFI